MLKISKILKLIAPGYFAYLQKAFKSVN